MKNIFNDLFVLDMANNHFGDLAHAKKIVSSFKNIIKKIKLKHLLSFNSEILKLLCIILKEIMIKISMLKGSCLLRCLWKSF